MFEDDILNDIKNIVNTSGSYNISLMKEVIKHSIQADLTLLGLKFLFGFAFYLYLDNNSLKLQFGDYKSLPIKDALVSEYFLVQQGEDIPYTLEKAKNRFLEKLEKCRAVNG